MSKGGDFRRGLFLSAVAVRPSTFILHPSSLHAQHGDGVRLAFDEVLRPRLAVIGKDARVRITSGRFPRPYPGRPHRRSASPDSRRANRATGPDQRRVDHLVQRSFRVWLRRWFQS